jgi:hypothetical protein
LGPTASAVFDGSVQGVVVQAMEQTAVIIVFKQES